MARQRPNQNSIDRRRWRTFLSGRSLLGLKIKRRKRRSRPGNRIRNELRATKQMLDSPRDSRTLFLLGPKGIRLVLPKRKFHQYRTRQVGQAFAGDAYRRVSRIPAPNGKNHFRFALKAFWPSLPAIRQKQPQNC